MSTIANLNPTAWSALPSAILPTSLCVASARKLPMQPTGQRRPVRISVLRVAITLYRSLGPQPVASIRLGRILD